MESSSSGYTNPASFRDPSGHVYHVEGRVFRTVTEQAVQNFEFVRDIGVYDELVDAGLLHPAKVINEDIPGLSQGGARYVLEHPRLPFISYPYEWSFSALKAAALLQLDIHLACLDRGVTLSDASAYNIQFIGTKPIFIDTLSFRPYRDGEYWTGHRQFCEQFLNPLLLRALLGIPHNNWYRGSLEGISTADLSALLPLHRKLSWNVLSQLVLPAFFDRSARGKGVQTSASALAKAKFPLPAFRKLLNRLRDWVSSLSPRYQPRTTWENYSQDNSYTPDMAALKREFVRSFITAERPAMVWDLGCNAGDYAEAALSAGGEFVVGWDFDQGALDVAFARAVERNLAFTPLFFDAANPAPIQGWAQQERYGMLQRGPADAILALAIVHHLAITRNIPLAMVANWLTSLAKAGVVEFAPKDDPMVQSMLSLREDIFDQYTLEHFEDCLTATARIERSQSLNGRHLIWFRRD